MTLSRDLAHLTGVKQADVELALQQGRFVVYAGLAHERVQAATEQLRSIGAVVQVRAAAREVQLEALEPDSRLEPGPQYGGPVAHFGDVDRALRDGAFNTAPGARQVEPPPGYNQQGIGRVIDEDSRTSRYQPVESEPLPVVDEMEALASGLDAAAFDAPAVTTIDGMDGAAFDAEEEAARKKDVPQPESTSVPAPGEPEPELSLDVDAPAGLTPVGSATAAVGIATNPPEESLRLVDTPPTTGRPAVAKPRGPSPFVPPPPAAAHAPPPSQSHMMRSPSGPADGEKQGLLFPDEVANVLGCIALASVLGVLVAFAATRSKHAAVMELEDEISESYRSPGDVERGKMRAPDAIQADLDEVYGAARFRFVLVLLALGVPGGLGLSRIRRPS